MPAADSIDRTFTDRRRLALLTGFVVLLAAPPGADALPDLRPELYGVRIESGQSVGTGDVAEGCARGTDDRILLRFGILVHNDGASDLVIGDPGCPDCATNPGALCTDPRFICSPADGHDHPHLLNWMRYELLDVAGNLIRLGGKKSFCVRDNRCVAGIPAFSCTDQGLSAGCVDDYPPNLGCQYLDVTDVPGATTRAFRLRAEVDPNREMPDGERGNDVTEVVVPGCGDGVLNGGEECDPGAIPPGPCCRNDCRLAPPGSCDPLPGLCGSPDAPVTDGTTCGSGAPPCLAQVCRGGICVGEIAETAGCMIGAACFVPGAMDPLNACQRCDPAVRADAWSLDRDADVEGLRCQLQRIADALTGLACRTAVRRELVFRLDRIDVLLGRRGGATKRRATRLDRRLDRQIDRLVRVHRRAADLGCAVDRFASEANALVQQFQAFRTSAG